MNAIFMHSWLPYNKYFGRPSADDTDLHRYFTGHDHVRSLIQDTIADSRPRICDHLCLSVDKNTFLLHFDGDLPRLDLLGLGDADGQHAVLVAGLGLSGLDLGGQADDVLELAVGALDPVVGLVLGLLLVLALARDRQHVGRDLDLDVVLGHARDLGLDHQLLLGLLDVHQRRPQSLGQGPPPGDTTEKVGEHPVHIVMEGLHFIEWVPFDQFVRRQYSAPFDCKKR
jgi:hypothetical protein